MSTASCAAARCGSTAAGPRPDYRVKTGDELRIPPVRVAAPASRAKPPVSAALERAVLFEDEHLLALNKPAGLAVHGGSGVSFGVIEQLRGQRPQARFLELVHRLDRDTSGVLLLAKKRSALTALHAELREGQVRKYYLALVKGVWRNKKQAVRLNLHKYLLASGERRVTVKDDGQESHTVFELQARVARIQPAAGGTQDRPHAPDPRASRASRISDRRRRQVRRFRTQQSARAAAA